MKIADICKGTSIILFFLSLIGSIILWIKFESIFVFLCVAVVSFIECLLIYALGEIIEQLECSNGNTYELYQLLKKLVPDEEKNGVSKAASASNIIKTAEGDGWICKKCAAKKYKY